MPSGVIKFNIEQCLPNIIFALKCPQGKLSESYLQPRCTGCLKTKKSRGMPLSAVVRQTEQHLKAKIQIN